MQAFATRFTYLFRSTRGLVLVAVAGLALVTAIWGTLSGPMAELGIKDVTVQILGFDLDPIEREGRLIMLYHSIAMTVVAIEVYLITDRVTMTARQQTSINATVTIGYLTALIFGLVFAYLGHNWIFHGLFIAGQTLVFFAGLQLAAALWPWQKAYHIKDKAKSHWGNIDLERVAYFTMAVATLGSALFGAIAGSFFGNGFLTFLGEDVVRQPNKPVLMEAIIGHLHIMLTLIGVAIALLVGQWLDFKGRWHKIAMPFMIFGTIVTTIGAWYVVVPSDFDAHTIIFVGSSFVLLAGLFLVIFGFNKLIQEQGGAGASFGQKMKALVKDSLKFGALWQMIFMNFTVSFVGIFMAVKLDEIIRVWPHREERIMLTGHWHILATLTATIILLYYADVAGLKGRVRQWFGWIVVIGSDLAFAAMTVFGLKRLFVSEAAQQPLVNSLMLLGDIGLVLVILALAAFLVWRLVDLFRRRGRWTEELQIDNEQIKARSDYPAAGKATGEVTR